MPLQVILVIVDNWQQTGGVDQYVAWATAATGNSSLSHGDFFTDPQIKQWCVQPCMPCWPQSIMLLVQIVHTRLHAYLPNILTGAGSTAATRRVMCMHAALGLHLPMSVLLHDAGTRWPLPCCV